MADPVDLFGNAGDPAQLSLFGEGDDRIPTPAQAFAPDPESIRKRLRAILEKARGATTMPWPERDVRMWEVVFPNMTNWLPELEAEQLRFEFFQEIERLKAA